MMLFASGVLDALEYTCVNDFFVHGTALAASAAGAVVALVGKNEDG
eukprot:COSAG02_NODE_67431_length_253_cov_0.649351_1_plen_45_part_10